MNRVMQREATVHADVNPALRGPASGVYIAIYLDLLASHFGLPP